MDIRIDYEGKGLNLSQLATMEETAELLGKLNRVQMVKRDGKFLDVCDEAGFRLREEHLLTASDTTLHDTSEDNYKFHFLQDGYIKVDGIPDFSQYKLKPHEEIKAYTFMGSFADSVIRSEIFGGTSTEDEMTGKLEIAYEHLMFIYNLDDWKAGITAIQSVHFAKPFLKDYFGYSQAQADAYAILTRPHYYREFSNEHNPDVISVTDNVVIADTEFYFSKKHSDFERSYMFQMPLVPWYMEINSIFYKQINENPLLKPIYLNATYLVVIQPKGYSLLGDTINWIFEDGKVAKSPAYAPVNLRIL